MKLELGASTYEAAISKFQNGLLQIMTLNSILPNWEDGFKENLLSHDQS